MLAPEKILLVPLNSVVVVHGGCHLGTTLLKEGIYQVRKGGHAQPLRGMILVHL